MSNIPNSYEEAQKLVTSRKQRRGSGLIRALVISCLSIFIILLIWILYPLPAPDFAIRSMLPANTAISIETHKPTELLKAIKESNYIEHLASLPLWNSLERLHRASSDIPLKQTVDTVLTDLNTKATAIIGIRNILAVAGGISYSTEQIPTYNAIAWLDNTGFLALKISTLLNKSDTFKGIKYYKIPINSRENLFIAPAPAYQRAILISTRLEALADFQLPPATYLDTEFKKTETTIEISLFPAKLPQQDATAQHNIEEGCINIFWTLTGLESRGELTFKDQDLSKLKTADTAQRQLKLGNTAPSLCLNLSLPKSNLQQILQQAITDLSKNSPPLLQPIFTNIDQILLEQLTGQAGFTLTQPSTATTNILQAAHLYLQLQNKQTTQQSFNQKLQKTIQKYRQSNNLAMQLLGTQLKTESNENTTTISLPPLLPTIAATFATVADIDYCELKLLQTAPYQPIAASSASPIFNTEWHYSQILSNSLVNSCPENLKHEVILNLGTHHQLLVTDILNFLTSSEFFTLSITPKF